MVFHRLILLKLINLQNFSSYCLLLFKWVVVIDNLKIICQKSRYLYLNKFYIRVNHDLAQAITPY